MDFQFSAISAMMTRVRGNVYESSWANVSELASWKAMLSGSLSVHGTAGYLSCVDFRHRSFGGGINISKVPYK